MELHRNSQKRFYFNNRAYFITSVTQNRYPYFKEEIFCKVFVENLKKCQKLKGFKLYGWFLGYDHCHLLIGPNDVHNISEIMRSLKTNVSCDINRITNPYLEGEVPGPRLQGMYQNKFNIIAYHQKFFQKYTLNQISFPKFKWQQSFHDHIIRCEKDFINHLHYIKINPNKHDMPLRWEYMWVDDDWVF